MKKISSLSIIHCCIATGITFLLATLPSVSQVNRCSFDATLKKNSNPVINSQLKEMESRVDQWIRFKSGQRTGASVTIPVVVHILYNSGNQNLSDSQIQSQIDVLNEDFRRLNADTVNTPLAFQAVAADIGLEFCLADKDPDGNATNGITRTATSKDGLTIYEMCYDSSGDKNAWPSDQYLNIWVCDFRNPAIPSQILQGTAQFPGSGPSETDGVIINYQNFGREGHQPSPQFNKGRKTTHEVGHWLGLSHLWGGQGCSEDDGITDTPLQSRLSTGCSTFPKHDQCTPSGDGIMFMNYMDLSNDSCSNMFTEGQKFRMLAVLNTERSGLLNSTGCSNSGGTVEGCKADFTYSLDSTLIDTTIVYSLTFSNTSFTTSDSVNWWWNFGDGTNSTEKNPVHTYPQQAFYNVCLVLVDSSGCRDSTCYNIKVGTSTQTPGDCQAGFTYVTLGDSADGSRYQFFDNSIPLGTVISRSWNFGGLDTSTAKDPKVWIPEIAGDLFTVCLSITDSVSPFYSCVNQHCDTVYQSTCIGDSCVWPGDANSSGTANVWDILPIGLHYGETGPQRQDNATSWKGHAAPDWGRATQEGVNLRHVDCDGNGQIELSDAGAILKNYGLSHNKTGNNERAGSFELLLEIPDDSIKAGEQLDVKIHLGTMALPADSVYGLAFSVGYNPDLVDPNSVTIDFGNSWLGTVGSDKIGLHKDLYPSGRVDIGISRTDHIDRSGYGQIGTLSFVMQDHISGKQAGQIGKNLILEIMDVEVLNAEGSPLDVGFEPDSITVYETDTYIDNDNFEELNVYPNPSGGIFNVPGDHVIIFNALGEIIYNGKGGYIDISGVSKGLYVIRAQKNAKEFYSKIIIE